MKYKVDDVLLCRVKKIEGTTVFLETEDGVAGSMLLSEVAAGRIRNLRDYVSPNRKIVCKVLGVRGEHLELSLRRVTGNERLGVLGKAKKERAFKNMLRSVGEKGRLVDKIKEVFDFEEFLEKIKEDIKILENFVSKENAKKLLGLLKERSEKDKKVCGKFILRSDDESGVEDIKEILEIEDCEIHYLGSGRFSISVLGKDFKEANAKMDEVLKEIGARAGRKNAKFEMEKK
ncbi:MAG: hypothetical protein ABIG28_01680 [archaeon]